MDRDRHRDALGEYLDSRMQDPEGEEHEVGSPNFSSLEWIFDKRGGLLACDEHKIGSSTFSSSSLEWILNKLGGLLACSCSLGVEEVVYFILCGRMQRRGT
mmetsp:Transcript_37860/g.91812  ORF Transcript_37860/g.91812 Transcript_37860/m.91812 type:complete len:101 (-) Transcript_37860:405-707(-)